MELDGPPVDRGIERNSGTHGDHTFEFSWSDDGAGHHRMASFRRYRPRLERILLECHFAILPCPSSADLVSPPTTRTVLAASSMRVSRRISRMETQDCTLSITKGM
jgi:hypothetical protein